MERMTGRGDPPEPVAGGSDGGPEPDLRARLARRLEPARDEPVPEGGGRQAGVVLLLRPGPETGGEAEVPREAETAPARALFVRRADQDGDPWAGHVALPGGHRDPGDASLLEAALRELAEETGIELGASSVIGRLPGVGPRSRRLPSVTVVPYVGWAESAPEVEPNLEIEDHLWIPVRELAAPERRSVLTFRRRGAFRAFPAIEYRGFTIWGLTYLIVRRFLEAARG